MSEKSRAFSRRTLTATAGGFAAGVFAARLGAVAAHEGHDHEASPGAGGATPEAVAAFGHAILRVRTLVSEDVRTDVNERVTAEFIPAFEALDGFAGYIVGDLMDAPANLTVAVLERAEDAAAYEEQVVGPFVGGLGDLLDQSQGREWSGEVMISAGPSAGEATPAPAPDWPLLEGYVAARVHTSLPGTDPREFVPLAISGFLPIVEGLDGFKGYLWFPVEGGFAAVSLFDSDASALASNEAARDWAAEHLAAYTDGNPEIFNATVYYANLPVLGAYWARS